MIKANLIRQKDQKECCIMEGYCDNNPTLITQTHGSLRGTFAAVTNTNAQTQTIAAPDGDDAIVLSDMIVSANKVQGSTVTVRFTDGTNTINLAIFDTTNQSVSLSISFTGTWQGWQGARLELVTDTNLQSATVAVGYFKISENKALSFTEWDARR